MALDFSLAPLEALLYTAGRLSGGLHAVFRGRLPRSQNLVPNGQALAELSDEDLLALVGQRDAQAFSLLYDRFSGVLFGVALRVLGDASEAEDALQEACLRIWDKAGVYDRRLGRPLGWAVALTRHGAIDRLRSARRRQRLVAEAAEERAEAPPAQGNPNGEVPAREQAALVRQAMATLPSAQRQAIELAFFGGLTQTEIATKLSEPLGTIKARIRRGMQALRESLERSGLERGATPEPLGPAS